MSFFFFPLFAILFADFDFSMNSWHILDIYLEDFPQKQAAECSKRDSSFQIQNETYQKLVFI